MAIPNKIVTAATAVLNKHAPFADRLLGSYPLGETSGTTFVNQGVNDDYGSGIDLGANGTALGGATMTFVSSATDPVNGPYITTVAGTASAGVCFRPYANGTGGAVAIPRGTVILRFKDPGGTPGATRVILSVGASPSLTGSLTVQRSTGNALQITNDSDLGTISFEGGTEIDWSTWHTLVICFGAGRNLTAYLDRNNTAVTAAGGTKSLANTFGISVPGARGILVGGTTTGATTYEISCSYFGLLDKRLDMYDYSSKHINRVLSDPWLYSRPAPDINTKISTCVSALVSRMTLETAHVSLVSGLGDTGDLTGVLHTTGLKMRALVGTSNDPTSANHCNNAFTSDALGDSKIIQPLAVTLTDLDHSTEHSMRIEWSDDNGTSWFPMPFGIQRFCTQRLLAGAWTVGFVSDPHLPNYVDIWDPEDYDAICYGAINYATGASRKALAYERGIQYHVLYHNHDFYFLNGDFLMSDTPRFAEADYTIDERNDLLFWIVSAQAASERNFAAELYGDGGFYIGHGNHETTNGYSQGGDVVSGVLNNNSAYQAVSLNVIKMYWPGPTDETYPEFGGEDEGDPSSVAVSWLAPNSGIFASYSGGHSQYKTDYVTGTHADPRDLAKSPLEIFYAFEWGGGDDKALFVNTHSTFYTDPGGADGPAVDPPFDQVGGRFRPLGQFTRGALQEAWIEACYSASTAPWRFEIAHQHTGGVLVGDATNRPTSGAGDSYGRNTGMTEPGTEHARDHDRAKRHGRTAKITGHDHRMHHAKRVTVNEINLPTPSAPSHSGGGSGTLGWHLTQHEQEAGFGLAETNGRDLVTEGDGLGTAAGNIFLGNCMGVAYLSFGEGPKPILRFVRTEISRGDDGAALNNTPSHIERFLPEPLTPVGGVVTLPSRPRCIAAVYLDSEIITDRTGGSGDPFWTTPPTNRAGSGAPFTDTYAHDLDNDAVAVTLDGAVTMQAVRVLYVPQVVYEVELSNASEEADESGMDPALLFATAVLM